MENKKIILPLIITLSLLIAGCAQQQKQETKSPFVGGSQGIVAKFEPIGVVEAGIGTVFDTEKFPVELTLKNKGEEDVPAGKAKIQLLGISVNDFTGIVGEKTSAKNIEKTSTTTPEGGDEIIDFGDAKYTVPISGTYYDINIFAKYTYSYKTYVNVPNVCFKGDVTSKEICTIEEAKTVFFSGAPIQVKKATEKLAGAGIIAIEFEIENVGGGRSTKPSEPFNQQYNQIKYVLTPSSETSKWECRSGGQVDEARLVGDKATVRCKLLNPLEKSALYTKQIGLEISYDYESLVQQTVRIKKAG